MRLASKCFNSSLHDRLVLRLYNSILLGQKREASQFSIDFLRHVSFVIAYCYINNLCKSILSYGTHLIHFQSQSEI